MEKKYGVLLDLDGTLYDYDPTHCAALKKTYRTLAKITDKVTTYEQFCILYYQAKLSVKKRLPETAASHNRILQFQKILEILNIPTATHSLTLYNSYWNSFLKKIKLFPGVLNYLENIHKQAIICLITNLTAHIQHRKIEKLNIAKYLDHIVTSEEVGLEKPHPIIFYHAMQKTRTSPKNTYIIGNSLQNDIKGAQKLGIQCLLFCQNQNKSIKNVVTFNSYAKAPKIPCKTI